jgi:hypothetical protein
MQERPISCTSLEVVNVPEGTEMSEEQTPEETIWSELRRTGQAAGNDLALTPPEEIMWSELLSTYRKLKASKPDERSDVARRWAICITEYEKALSIFHTMILSKFEG